MRNNLVEAIYFLTHIQYRYPSIRETIHVLAGAMCRFHIQHRQRQVEHFNSYSLNFESHICNYSTKILPHSVSQFFNSHLTHIERHKCLYCVVASHIWSLFSEQLS